MGLVYHLGLVIPYALVILFNQEIGPIYLGEAAFDGSRPNTDLSYILQIGRPPAIASDVDAFPFPYNIARFCPRQTIGGPSIQEGI
jgi:hypothetical protein